MGSARRGGRTSRGSDRGSRSQKSHGILAGYFERAKQPLEILAVIAPLVVLYEVGLVYALRSSQGTFTNGAHEGLVRFFTNFGVDPARLNLPTLGLPGVALIVVLLVWQLLSRKPWSLHLPTVCGMIVESALLALPLLVVAQLVTRAFVPALVASPFPAQIDVGMGALSTFGKISMSVGAGLYEELIFRMVLLSLLHTALVDMARLPERWGIAIAVLVSALLFALYHPLRTSSGLIDARRLRGRLPAPQLAREVFRRATRFARFGFVAQSLA